MFYLILSITNMTGPASQNYPVGPLISPLMLYYIDFMKKVIQADRALMFFLDILISIWVCVLFSDRAIFLIFDLSESPDSNPNYEITQHV